MAFVTDLIGLEWCRQVQSNSWQPRLQLYNMLNGTITAV